MTEQARANVSFDHVKRGDWIQVDPSHPRIAALVQAGYLTIDQKGPVDAEVAAVHAAPGWVSPGSGGDLVGPLAQQETVTDGDSADLPKESDSVR